LTGDRWQHEHMVKLKLCNKNIFPYKMMLLLVTLEQILLLILDRL